jgi:hypothetical protein
MKEKKLMFGNSTTNLDNMLVFVECLGRLLGWTLFGETQTK